jgi:drug/metabolite transporter (DMT)-like permease
MVVKSANPLVLPSAGIVLMCASVFLSPLIDIFAKLATATIPAGEITGARFLFQTLFVLPFVLRRGRLFSRSRRQTFFHFLRGLLIVMGMTAFTYTLKIMPVADAIAIFFVEPAILTLMSGLFLKEHISRNKIIACATGFLGSLLVIQPSFSQFGFVSLLPVVTAFTVALFLMLTRMLSRTEDPWSMQFQSSVWGLAIAALLLAIGHFAEVPIYDPVMPSPVAILYLAGVGLSATVAGMLSIYAYRATPASVLAPLQYLEIVSACIFAYWVFGDFPDLLKWIGILIIIGSGLFIIWREDKPAASVRDI